MSVSAVVLNWNRPSWLRRVILPLLARHPLVDEIHVSHGAERTCFSFESPRCEIVHRHEVPPVAVPLPMLDSEPSPWSWGILRNQGDGFIVSGAGGSPPWARWGRTVLYSRLHCSTSTVASGSV